MNNSQLVSVVVNCYNGEKYLNQCINSILNQTYKNIELIFWDNQSTDNSRNIINSFKDKRIKYFYAPTHEKLYSSRNFAIENGEPKTTSGQQEYLENIINRFI